MDNCYEWYREIMMCYAQKDNVHNFVPVTFAISQYTKQAVSLMCTHCLQLIELKDVQEFNSAAKLLETSDSV
jgi:hypothetical protein